VSRYVNVACIWDGTVKLVPHSCGIVAFIYLVSCSKFQREGAQCGKKVQYLLLAGNCMRQYRTARDSTAWNEDGHKEYIYIYIYNGSTEERKQ
jgi:hypothetical protein